MLPVAGALVLLWPAAAQPPEPASTLKATAAEVVLDIVVRDKRGKVVRNLKAGDLEIYEDGMRQEVKSFRFAGGRGARRQETQAGSAARTAASAAPSAASRPLRAVNLVCIVLHNLDPVARRRAMEAIEEFLMQEQPAGTLLGAFQLDDRLTPLAPFTASRDELLQAARTGFPPRPLDFSAASEAVFSANPTRYVVNVSIDAGGRSATITAGLQGGEVNPSTVAGAEINTGTGANTQRGDHVAARRDFANLTGAREADKINNLIRYLGALPGRKTVLLASTGLITTGDPDSMEALFERAAKAGITVYPLDVTGLSANSASKAGEVALNRASTISGSQSRASQPGLGELGAMKEKSRQGDNIEIALRSSDAQAGLRALAEGTGGFLIANTNEFTKPFQRIVEEADAHYEAVYRPSSGRLDGRLRQIEVKPARAGLTVESRKGYFALPELKGGALRPHESLGLAALSEPAPPRDFGFHQAALQFGGRQALAVSVPASALAATPRPERGVQAMHVSVLALVKDASGQVVDKYSTDAPYEIPEANLAAVRNSTLSFSHPLGLPPGRYQIESIVLDREGRRAGVAASALEVAESRPAVGISSVLLVERLEQAGAPDPADPLLFQGQRIIPYLAPDVPPEATPMAYFVVYPNQANAARPRIDVEFLVDGQSLAKQSADLPAPDSTGAIPMVIRAATRPGQCELRITAVQGSETAPARVTYRVPKS